MFVLVADDEGPKLESIVDAVSKSFVNAEIVTARSVRSALDILRDRTADVVVLDMSLPTFDVAPGEQGGRPQNYGGIELLRYMDFYEISSPVFIVTQYEAFPDKGGHVDLSELGSRLKREHPRTFQEIIYYGGSTDDAWRRTLNRLLDALRKEQL
jgi:CheY-like chemotaxis protein